MMKTVLRFCAAAFALSALFVFAAIYAPRHLRLNQRSCATKIVNDARIYEAAIDQWAAENKAPEPPPPPVAETHQHATAAADSSSRNDPPATTSETL